MPVSGSGDVTTIQQTFDRFRETGCDGVLIGRGAMANPWIFRQIEDVMHGREPFQPTLEDKRALLLEYFEMLQQDMPKIAAIGRMKQLAGQFTRGLQGGALFRTALYHSHSVEEILGRISEYFEAINNGRPYYGEGRPPGEIIEAPRSIPAKRRRRRCRTVAIDCANADSLDRLLSRIDLMLEESLEIAKRRSLAGTCSRD